jgi:hypothetical protein
MAEKHIDDLVDEWHASGPEEIRSLAEFLGMTEEEYKRWVETCEVPSRLKKEQHD